MNYISPSAVGDNAEFVTPLGLAFTLLMALLLVASPRRYALAPIIMLVCYTTMGERIVVAGFNFTMIRVLLVFGWLRLVTRGELRRLQWSTVDTLIITWAIVRTINYTLVFGTTDALVNRLGYAYNIIGGYFLFRFLIRDPEDVYRAIRYLAIAIGPLALCILNEKLNARNVFAVFGGVPLIPEVRSGVLRCQGPFAHSILAGTFGATVIPLFVGMWLFRRSTLGLALLAIVSATVIVLMGGSSGPVLAYAFGVLALMLWPIRGQLRIVRWGIVLLFMVLQFVMNTPVWFVIARVSVFSGSTGWYRGFLIDMSVRHLDEWWLFGTSAATTWHYYLADVTNQYLLEGLSGGLPSMFLFIAILAVSFRSVGRTVRSSLTEPKLKYLMWALGAALLGHLVSFVSVSYFDQNIIVFYMLLAAIAGLGVMPATAVQRTAQRATLQVPPLSSLTMWPSDPNTRYSR